MQLRNGAKTVTFGPHMRILRPTRWWSWHLECHLVTRGGGTGLVSSVCSKPELICQKTPFWPLSGAGTQVWGCEIVTKGRRDGSWGL